MAWAAEARRLNLCQPFQSEPALTETCLSDSEFWDLNESVNDQSNFSQDALKSFCDDATNERWNADREGVAFLANVISMSSISSSKVPVATPLWIDVKTVEPMLKTDPEMEMLRLRRRHAVSLRRYKRSGLIDESSVLNPWSQNEVNLPQALTQNINTIRLDIDRPTMEFLRGLLPIVDDDRSALGASVSEDVSVQHLRFDNYCTSPLIPSAPSPKLLTLAPAVQDVAFTSTPDDLMVLDLARAQQDIEALDEFEDLDMSCLDDFDTACTVDQDITSPLERKRARDLKVETPITALKWEASPKKRRKTTHLPDTVLALIPPMSSSDGGGGSLSMDPLTNAAASIARATIFQIENEQLTEFDTTMRTEVPVIDMRLPPAPWAKNANQDELAARTSSHRTLLSQFKRELLREVNPWGGMSGIEDALRRLPFSPRWGEIRPDGPFDDGSFTRYLKGMDLETEPEVHSLIAFDGRLIVYDEDDDDEEEGLDLPLSVPDQFSLADDNAVPSQNHRTAVSEKRNELPQAKAATEGKPDLAALVQRRMQQLTDRPAKTSEEHIKHIHSTDANLAKFMRLTGRTHVAHEAPPEVDHHPPEPTEDSTSKTQERIQINLAVPPLIKPDRAIQAIFARVTLGNTTMIRQLQTLLPALDMIERDEILDGPKPEQAAAQNLNHEADITVSPSIGIILTTLQRLNQTGLPGQRSYFGIRERIAAASVRYERLIVLVSESRQQQRQQEEGGDGKVAALATGSLSDRDCENLADLTSCGLGKDSGEVEVHYVPGGGQEVAQWIAACMTQHAVVSLASSSSSSSAGGGNDSVKLLREETQWERFLRRAGMNAFAAQAVLGKVKTLARFVELGVEERIEQLEGDVGGTRVLRRVSRVIDEGWRSAAGGHGD